jgi:hypothetical protein
MSAPITSTFYESPIKKDIINTLKRANKTLDDIDYVSYAVTKPNYEIEHFRCDISEFLLATTYATSLFDIKLPFEISIVGDGFWLSFDYRGCWNLNVPPTKPMVYRRPLSCHLLKDINETEYDEPDIKNIL